MKKRFTEEQIIGVLKELKQENNRLKKRLAESMPDKAALQDLLGRK